MLTYKQILFCVLFCLYEAFCRSSFTDFYFESIQIMNGTYNLPFTSLNASLKRSGRDHPNLFLEFEINDDFRNYDIEIKIYYSPLGNKRYLLLPYKFGLQPLCKIYNNDYVKKVFYGMRNCTNFSISDDPNVEFCDLLQLGHYFLRKCSIDPSILPPYISPGRYRVSILFYKKGERRQGVSQVIEFQSVFT